MAVSPGDGIVFADMIIRTAFDTAHTMTLATSLAATLLRGGLGVATSPSEVQPEVLLELYEFEACPTAGWYARRLRSSISTPASFPAPRVENVSARRWLS